MQGLLSFEKAPPFAAPLRFFLTAPLFGVLAGLLLVVGGGDGLASRWLPTVLAATHLITVGFMLQIMIGALVQVLPVIAGANLARPMLVARISHVGLTFGAFALAGAFLFGAPLGFRLAAIALVGTAAVFVLAAGYALYGVPSTSPTIRGLKLALAGLVGAVTLGVTLALALANGWSLPLTVLADLHAGWGLGAWSGVLLVSMSYVVVPMFQLTPGYPARLSWWLPPVVALLLVLWSLAVGLGTDLLIRVAEAATAVAGIGFAVFTLRLQRQRRRARADATHHYWQGGLGCSLAALAMLLVAAAWPVATEWPGWALLFGILLGAGGFMSFIIGMLYKIVPFLSWMHLQNMGQGRVMAPNMNKILPENRMQWQMRAHFAAFALLVAAVFLPEWLARPAGAAFAFSNAWLFVNLLTAVRVYRREVAVINEKLAA